MIYTCALMIALIASLGLSSLRVLALLMEFDDAAKYYEHGAVLPIVFAVGALVAVGASLAFTIVLRGSLDRVGEATNSYAHIFASALAGFVIIGCSLLAILSGEAGPGFLGVLPVILSVPAALYFLIGKALPVGTKNLRIIMSAFLGLWFFSVIVRAYFVSDVEINNPNRTMLLVALAAATLYFIAEGRFRVGNPNRPRYVFLGLAAIVLIGLYALPNTVLIILRAYPDSYELGRELVMLTLFLYVLIRMCIVVGMVGDEETYYYDEYGEEEADGKENAEAPGVTESYAARRGVNPPVNPGAIPNPVITNTERRYRQYTEGQQK